MPPFEAIISVIIAGLALSVTPGPSMLYVLSRSVGQSRSAGLASALGLGLGGTVLAVAAALGLSALFERVEWLAVALRYVGSAYLVWLGVGIIRDAYTETQTDLEIRSVRHESFSAIIWQGVVVEILNPKTLLFFALFLPPFVHLGNEQVVESSVQIQLLILGVLVPLTAIPSDLLVAYLGGTMTQVLKRRQAYRATFAWASGLVLIGIALNLHLELL